MQRKLQGDLSAVRSCLEGRCRGDGGRLSPQWKGELKWTRVGTEEMPIQRKGNIFYQEDGQTLQEVAKFTSLWLFKPGLNTLASLH